VPGLHAVVVEKRFVSVLTKQDSGLYRYVSHERHYPHQDQALALAASAKTFALPTDVPGDYILEVHGADGAVLNQIDYSVAGAGNVSRSLERNAELTLSITSFGVPLGAYSPCQIVTLKPFRPDSSSVGRFFSAGVLRRLGVVTAKAFTLPDSICVVVLVV